MSITIVESVSWVKIPLATKYAIFRIQNVKYIIYNKLAKSNAHIKSDTNELKNFHCSSRKVPRFPTCHGLLNSLLTLAGMELRRGDRGGVSGMLSNNFRFPSLDLALEVVVVTDKDKGSVKLVCPK